MIKKKNIFQQLHKPTRPKLVLDNHRQPIEGQNFIGLKGFRIHNTPLKQKEMRPNFPKSEGKTKKEQQKAFSQSSLSSEEQTTDKIQTCPPMIKEKALQNSENKTRVRNSSVIMPRSRSSATSNFFKRASTLSHQSKGKAPSQIQNLCEIQQYLKNQNLISPLNALIISVKRKNLHEIILKIIKASIQNGMDQSLVVDPLKASINSIKVQLNKSSYQITGKKRQIINKIFNVIYNPSIQKESYWNKTKQFQQLTKKLQKLKEQISEKATTLSKVIDNRSIKETQAKHFHRQIYDMQQKIRIEQIKYEEIEGKNREMERKLALVDEKYQKMLSEVSIQNTHLVLKQVSRQYLQIQSQIYEYASYLQCNQLANDIYYEPHPYTQIQAQIDEELKLVVWSISENKEKSLEQKLEKMTNFVVSSMTKFKNKDKEMFKLNQFKTKCILTFISKMKRYLNNWELKHEYLINLKKEYASHTIDFNDILSRLQTHPLASQQLRAQFKKLSNLSEKLQGNFNLGNSFY